MQIAFYAPLKPPDHSVPSGDRNMARLLIKALTLAGHEVIPASRLRSRVGDGDVSQQERMARLGEAMANRLLRRYQRLHPQDRPQAWFTYHLYYKAPDWIGPRVAKGLNIPYLVAEASVANKRAQSPWRLSHQSVLNALAAAATVVVLNPADAECLPKGQHCQTLIPFLDPAPFQGTAAERANHRAALIAATGAVLDPNRPWLLTVAMMREGDKLASYRLLAQSLHSLPDIDWQLIIAGDGPAKAAVQAAFSWARPDQVIFVGEAQNEASGDTKNKAGRVSLATLYAAADILAWPAVNEAYGMALLEAQASGLPVVAGRYGGVSAVVHDGYTGLLTTPGDGAAFAAALRSLLTDPAKRQAMAEAAASRVADRHGLTGAAAQLDLILRQAIAS